MPRTAAERRDLETPAEREDRLALSPARRPEQKAEAKRKRDAKLAAETPEQREARLARQREYNATHLAKLRATETPEQSERRLWSVRWRARSGAQD